MDHILEPYFVNQNIPIEREIKQINVNVNEEIEKTSHRAFNELISAGVIDKDKCKTIVMEHNSSKDDNLTNITYSIIEDILYIRWIWVADSIRGFGIGTEICKHVLDKERNEISEAYVMTKSSEAESIFRNKLDFNECSDIQGNWYKKQLNK